MCVYLQLVFPPYSLIFFFLTANGETCIQEAFGRYWGGGFAYQLWFLRHLVVFDSGMLQETCNFASGRKICFGTLTMFWFSVIPEESWWMLGKLQGLGTTGRKIFGTAATLEFLRLVLFSFFIYGAWVFFL
jgi:hypothetical protein